MLGVSLMKCLEFIVVLDSIKADCPSDGSAEVYTE
jgi:hypothetical protein